MRCVLVLAFLVALGLTVGCGGKYGPAATPANPAPPPTEKGSKPDLPVPSLGKQ